MARNTSSIEARITALESDMGFTVNTLAEVVTALRSLHAQQEARFATPARVGKAASRPATQGEKVPFTKTDGTVVMVSPARAAQWGAFRAQGPANLAKAQASTKAERTAKPATTAKIAKASKVPGINAKTGRPWAVKATCGHKNCPEGACRWGK